MPQAAEPTLFYIPYQRFLDELEAVAGQIEADDWRHDTRAARPPPAPSADPMPQ